MNIVITGVSRGIGYETVKALIAKSEHKVVCIARSEQELNLLKSECYKLNPLSSIFVIPFDLRSLHKKEDLLSKILRFIPNVDILINNAGSLLVKPIEGVCLEEINQVFHLNFNVPFLLMQMLSGHLTSNAHVLNISSMGGFQDSAKFSGLSIYSSAKAALNCLTQVIAAEWSERSIAVNALAIGAVNTQMLSEAFPEYKAPVEAFEMGAYIANFAVEGRKYYNGKILPVALSNP
ncbi:MAG: SDR family NAD(P)-dependent oxidoreductase [Bacteroidales bacterium]